MPTQSRAIVQITARNGIGTNTPTSNAAWGIDHANKLLDVLASDPDVQISGFRFFTEELRSRLCTDGRSGLLAVGDA